MESHRHALHPPPGPTSRPLPELELLSLQDPLFSRIYQRTLSRRRGHSPRVFRLSLFLCHALGFFLTFSNFGYLLSTILGPLTTYCPGPDDALVYISLWALFLFGLAIWVAFIWLPKWAHLSLLTIFACTLLVPILIYDDLAGRLKVTDLTDDELDHFTAFDLKMAAIGQCALSLKITLGLLHLMFTYTGGVLLVHLVFWAIRKVW